MKNFLFALSLFAIASPALAKSPKLVISYTPNGQESEGCKISEKEIAKILEKNKDKGLCTKILTVSPAKEELTPESLAQLVALEKENKGKLSLAFTGTEGTELAQTATAWLDFLALQNKSGRWAASVASVENSVAVLQIENEAGETLSLPVILGFEIKKDEE